MRAAALALALYGIGGPAFAAPAWCPDLKRVTDVAATNRLDAIAGPPREGSFRDTTLPLAGWRDCSLYGARTYTCDSHGFRTVEEGDRAFTKTIGEVKACLRDGWAEDESRASPGYVVLRDQRQVASITINTAEAEKGEHVVRLILFLRSR